jgi:hypothetical protein
MRGFWSLRSAAAIAGLVLLVAGLVVALEDNEAIALLVVGAALLALAIVGERVTELTATRGETTATVRLSPHDAAEAALAAADETIRGIERSTSSEEAVAAIEAARAQLDELRRSLSGSFDVAGGVHVWTQNDPWLTVGHWYTSSAAVVLSFKLEREAYDSVGAVRVDVRRPDGAVDRHLVYSDASSPDEPNPEPEAVPVAASMIYPFGEMEQRPIDAGSYLVTWRLRAKSGPQSTGFVTVETDSFTWPPEGGPADEMPSWAPH